MYTPNFCCECGAKVLRLRWHFWTSRKFCDQCARSLRKARLLPAVWIAVALLGAGYVAGRYRRSIAPPLLIERKSDSPLSDKPVPYTSASQQAAVDQITPKSDARFETEVTYQCGARTKKGTPCSRRVHGPVRCWQHKGMKAMLAQEKLRVEE